MCIRDRREGELEKVVVGGAEELRPEERREPALGKEGELACLLYTSDAADERSSVDLGGRRIIKKKKRRNTDDHIARAKLLNAYQYIYSAGH